MCDLILIVLEEFDTIPVYRKDRFRQRNHRLLILSSQVEDEFTGGQHDIRNKN